jgi:uncharacterized Zn finger protein (UPF0148 family)
MSDKCPKCGKPLIGVVKHLDGLPYHDTCLHEIMFHSDNKDAEIVRLKAEVAKAQLTAKGYYAKENTLLRKEISELKDKLDRSHIVRDKEYWLQEAQKAKAENAALKEKVERAIKMCDEKSEAHLMSDLEKVAAYQYIKKILTEK